MGESSTVWGVSLAIALSFGCGQARDECRCPGGDAGESPGNAQGGEPNGSAGSSAEGGAGAASRVVLGCRNQPLTLGPASSIDRAPQMVWTGSTFAVGWVSPDGYEVRLTDGSSISNTLILSDMPEAGDPQLFWTGSGLELYYSLEDSVVVDSLQTNGGPLAVVRSDLVGVGSQFRAVLTEPGKVAVVTNGTLFLDGNSVPTRIFSIGELGWNGEYFLISSVLGHGEWNLNRLDTDGRAGPSPIELRWAGINGNGRGGGSYFASTPNIGRHALVVAASGELTFAVEGFPTFERAMLEPGADASVFWNGTYYLVLLANGPATNGAGQRNIFLLAFTKEGDLVSDVAVPISEHAADERFPVGIAADQSTFGVAWIQDGELVVQRCSAVFR
ncbi:MAG TPA: hypothetical protein VIM73_13930 [Polyangiaceae bacterium]